MIQIINDTRCLISNLRECDTANKFPFIPPPSLYLLNMSSKSYDFKFTKPSDLSSKQGLLNHRTCKPDFLCSLPSLNSYL